MTLAALKARLADLFAKVTQRTKAQKPGTQIIDWGVVTVISPKMRQVEVEVFAPSAVTSSLEGLTVTPDTLPAAGRYTLDLTLDPANLAPSALLEGTLLVGSIGQALELRVTGTVDDSGIEAAPSSITTHAKPWALITRLVGHGKRVRSLAFLSDSRILVSGADDCTVRWWNLEQRLALGAPEEFGSEVWSVAASRDGQLLAVGLRDGTISVREALSRRELWCSRVHQGTISGLAFSPDSTVLVAGSGDCTFSVMDATSGRLRYEPIPQQGVITSIALSGNGLVLASTSQIRRRVMLWEVQTGAFLRELLGHTSNVWSIAFSLDGYLLASGSADKTVRVWDTQTGEVVSTLEGFERKVNCVTVSPDGTLVATASDEPKVRVWSIKSERRLANLESSQALLGDLAFSPDQAMLAGGLYDGQVYIWAVQPPDAAGALQ